MNITFHESLYRTKTAMEKLRGHDIVICGAGALGANIAESLARAGVERLTVIDRDRVEEHNLSTQPFQTDDIGARKAEVLAHTLYRAVGQEVNSVCKELDRTNVHKLLKNATLVIDCFDNSVSRRIVTKHCLEKNVPCLHAGLADGFAEVIWNDHYRVPSPSQDDICDYPLARNLVTLTTAVACETVIKSLLGGTLENWSITLKDLQIAPLPM